MGNVFQIPALTGTIANAKDKAIAMASDYGLRGVFEGRVMPVTPPLPKGLGQQVMSPGTFDEAYIIESGSDLPSEYSLYGVPMCFPLKMKLMSETASSWWLLPIEPIITMGGSNNLIRRKVAKQSAGLKRRRGTIKEVWSADDLKITIDGVLTRFDEWRYPTEDVARLREIIEAREPIEVQCEIFEVFGISRIAIDEYDIPFTKGEENQAYRITAYSDDDWDLLIKK